MSNPETTLCWEPLRDQLVTLRQQCLRSERPAPHWDRVENIAGSGTPDLSWGWDCGEGHIELKHRYDVPVGELTPVTLPTITAHQRLWWRQRWEAGANAFVLLRLANEFLLFPGLWAAHNLGNTHYQGLLAHAAGVWQRGQLSAEEVLRSSCR